MAKQRAYGADAQLIDVVESVYGTAPDGAATGVYRKLSFKSHSLGAERPLGYDPLLGQGRDAQDPHYDAITVSGDVVVPVDLQGFGHWLKKALGAPDTTPVAATGYIQFSANPSNNHTITLNGITWTFKTSGATGNQTNLGGTLADTLTALVSDLNGSADAGLTGATYGQSGGNRLTVTHDTAGSGGNAYTLASGNVNGVRSAATLTGGHYAHVFTSGGELPSSAMQLGHTALTTPIYYMHTGVKVNTLEFDMATSGPVNATIGLIAQGETEASAAEDTAPLTYSLTRFNNGSGTIKLDGVQLGSVTAGKLSFSNNLDAVQTIRDDGLIDGVDETEATATGTVDVRFGTDTTISDAVNAETPVAFQYAFAIPNSAGGYAVEFDLPRVFLPKKKGEVGGPGGVSKSYEWRAAFDSGEGHMMQVTLKNDVASYA